MIVSLFSHILKDCIRGNKKVCFQTLPPRFSKTISDKGKSATPFGNKLVWIMFQLFRDYYCCLESQNVQVVASLLLCFHLAENRMCSHATI